ncbi:MAG: hypothetical protein MPEBLZ_03702 [Candidatus Methanoperedens nitroreducens]|uniref:Uncharacterized protein n=1 Tax=Candidatus Methanoperedens nitratireducens TaxID=1392998 RepID=A0A0P8CGC3_9EURY|nr:MAG: hypothetical protein MPEBLZ_03702 [Candidatus Methanoperedens sp. BLZ1]
MHNYVHVNGAHFTSKNKKGVGLVVEQIEKTLLLDIQITVLTLAVRAGCYGQNEVIL